MRVVERVAGHYAVEGVEDFGKVYRWHPESVVLECECGKHTSLKRSDVIAGKPSCECGAVPTGEIREEAVLAVLDESEAGLYHRHASERTGSPV